MSDLINISKYECDNEIKMFKNYTKCKILNNFDNPFLIHLGVCTINPCTDKECIRQSIK